MAIHNEEKIRTGSGQSKQIDEGSLDIFFQTLQKYQYQFPVKSTVREYLSNGVDSIAEKKVARAILSGEAKVEDYYVERDGKAYSHSRFDAGYYDLAWLSSEDKVELQYISGTNTTKDTVVFSDTGVGLGGSRLQGFFNLGFSTKRLSKLPIGKWGVGAKSALSTGVDMYTMESCYNGKRYRFNIFSKTFDSIVPRWNTVTGEKNGFEVWNAGTPEEYTVYHEPTSEKNGVRIFLDVKKHHKQQYIDAVSSQMLYFSGVTLKVDGNPVEFKASVLYEDDYIMLADQSYYSKPHLLLNRVNYGYINWEELELIARMGNIGIKVAPEDVDINPSRETLIWSDKTKQLILERIENVRTIATQKVSEQLKTDDFLLWLRTAYTLQSRGLGQSDNIVKRLSDMVKLEELEPSFSGMPAIKMKAGDKGDPTYGLLIKHVLQATVRRKNEDKIVFSRKEKDSLSGVASRPVALMKFGQRASNRKDKYLISVYGDFVMVFEPYLNKEQAMEYGRTEEEYTKLAEMLRSTSGRGFTRTDIFELLSNSSDVLKYEDIQVPASFGGTDEEEEDADESEEAEEQRIVRTMTESARRKLEGKTLLQTPNMNAYGMHYNNGVQHMLDFKPVEVKIRDINDWQAEEVYYGTEEDRELITCAAILSRDSTTFNGFGEAVRADKSWDTTGVDQEKWSKIFPDYAKYDYSTGYGYYLQHFVHAPVILVKVAKDNVKYYRDFLHVTKFFMRIENNKVTMSNTLIKWNTARYINDRLADLKFLRNFKVFNETYFEKYYQLEKYVNTHWRTVTNKDARETYGIRTDTMADLVSHLDRLQQFQELVRHSPENSEAIGSLALQMFGNAEINDAHAVDMTYIELLQDVLDFAQSCGPLFNYIPMLTDGQTDDFPQDLELEIKQVLAQKGILGYVSERQIPQLASPEASQENAMAEVVA